jgi:hypothetical protein
MRAERHLLTVIVLGTMSTFHGGALRAQALPQPADLIAKPPYIALVRAMRADETLLTTLRSQIESEKHAYKPECLANLRPDLLTSTLAWAIEPGLNVQEVAEATRFFENDAEKRGTPAGAAARAKSVLQEPRVLLSAKAEVLDLLNTCTDTLEGIRKIVYCQSDWVPSPDKACSARYEVTGTTGDSARDTRVSLYCKFDGSDLSSLLTELPGRHETIGLNWRESRTLEMLLPPAVKPLYEQSSDGARGLRYEYHTRKPSDPPAAACIPSPPVDAFGWPRG